MSPQPVGVGIVGYGYWGPNLVRNFQEARTTRVAGICERDPGRRAKAATSAPGIPVVADLEELLALAEVEAVAIATPVRSHHALARRALESGRHVFVEKPFTYTAEEALDLIRLARRQDRRIMVDHTFVYTGAVMKLREITRAGDLGELLYYDSVRINLGLFQPDVDVIWDLAPHDFSILDHVVPTRPQRISAIGSSHAPSGHSDLAYVTLDFGSGFLGHLHLNWLAPVKVRQIMIGGSRKMAVYNDVLPDEKIRIYDRGIQVESRPLAEAGGDEERERRYQTMISYRTGDVHAPWLDRTEALHRECKAFGHAIRSGEPIETDSIAGLRVVLMLEAASRSLQAGGGFVAIDWDLLESASG